MLGFPQDTLLWLHRILETLSSALQASQPVEIQTSAHNNNTVPRRLLTTKLLDQVQAKHQQAAAAMNEAMAAWQIAAKKATIHGCFDDDVIEVLHRLQVADAEVQQQLQKLGKAITAAVPVVWCCNNAACVKFIRLNERMVKYSCSKCKAAKYCCMECQEAQWKLHKPVCKVLRRG